MGCRVKTNRHGNLALRLIFNGLRSWEGTEHKEDDLEARKILEARAAVISHEMDEGTFDYLKWFPAGNKAALFRAESVNRKPQTIRSRYPDWITDKVPPFVKKSRARKYREHFNAHILTLQGDKYLHLYSVADIRQIRAHLVEKKKLKMKTVKNIVNATLRAFFRDAQAEGLIKKNPFDDLPKKFWPKTPPPPPSPFEEKERDEIIAHFKQKYAQKWLAAYVFVLSLFWTGCRPSELTARRWRDYDPRTGKLEILDSRDEGEEGDTKTPKSKRTIELLAPVRETLEQLRPLRATPDDYIFTQRNGKPIDQKEFAWRHFWPALTVLKITKRDFYSTRDTFISVMLSHGEQLKAIAEYCGTSAQMIDQSYGKYMQGKEAFGAAALAATRATESTSSETPGETLPEQLSKRQRKQKLAMVRGGGFEPPQEKIDGARKSQRTR